MKIVLAITGASGAIYAQRLVHALSETACAAEVIMSRYAREIAAEETGGLAFPPSWLIHDEHAMHAAFTSGSALYDAMVIVPCSMGTLGRIAHGCSDNAISRTADVFLKEKRKLILVPRETPWNLIHARNAVAVIEAGATLLPAAPSFYGKPKTIEELADTVVARILDHLGIANSVSKRWPVHVRIIGE